MPGIADALYQSEKWHRTKNAYLTSKHYICERCGAPAVIVHHREHLNALTMRDPAKALAFDNLEALCQTCHNREHFGDHERIREGMYFDADGNTVVTTETAQG